MWNAIRHWWHSTTTDTKIWLGYFVLIGIVIVILVMEILSYLG